MIIIYSSDYITLYTLHYITSHHITLQLQLHLQMQLSTLYYTTLYYDYILTICHHMSPLYSNTIIIVITMFPSFSHHKKRRGWLPLGVTELVPDKHPRSGPSAWRGARIDGGTAGKVRKKHGEFMRVGI